VHLGNRYFVYFVRPRAAPGARMKWHLTENNDSEIDIRKSPARVQVTGVNYFSREF
jgi:hypothetical protein